MEGIYRGANVFCLPSRWEGFPNALAEALAHGVPTIGFSDCAGVNLLIQPGQNGLLAAGNNNPDSLADALRQLMESSALRSSLGSNAPHSVEQYETEKIFDKWENVFLQVAKGQSPR
jgi:glycosyltransferase involved in cell wall biosynthesis